MINRNIKYLIIQILIVIITMDNISSCTNSKPRINPVRHPAVAGQFYPSDKDSIIEMMKGFFKSYITKTNYENVAALIVPHAGYVYSGAVAASAYSQIDPNKTYDNIFLIGPSHHVYLNGASINIHDGYYETPLGDVEVNLDLGNKLVKDYSCFTYDPKAHAQEHCLEVQIPFLQYWLKKMPPIVPIIVATQNIDSIQQIANALKPYFNDKNLFVISSDFSHYTTYSEANKVDKHTGEAIMQNDVNSFIEAISENSEENAPNLVTSACGQSAIATLLLITQGNPDIEVVHNDYKNSGDSPYGDHHQVVGYHAFTFIRTSNVKEFSLSHKEEEQLLEIARNTITNRLEGRDNNIKESELTPNLKAKCGAFVTLHENGRLRGCIGHFGSDIPLYKTVEEMALSAAFGDPRFYPVQLDELKNIDIEISVLTPMKKINSIDEFKIGRDGIYIEKDGHAGTFLPQVAKDTGWSTEEFLGHCAQDKVGIGWDGWKNANLYTYQAIIFSEKQK